MGTRIYIHMYISVYMHVYSLYTDNTVGVDAPSCRGCEAFGGDDQRDERNGAKFNAYTLTFILIPEHGGPGGGGPLGVVEEFKRGTRRSRNRKQIPRAGRKEGYG